MQIGVEARSDCSGQFDVFGRLLLLFEDLKRLVSGLGLGDSRVGEMLANDDLLADLVLVSAITAADDFQGSVGDGL